jgi:2-iminoacetate synthase
MFSTIFDRYEWAAVKQDIYHKTARDVEAALGSSRRGLEDFKALISPAAAPYLEEMAQMSNRLTQRRFGKVIQLYIPLYLSNECQNICTYCGFSYENKIRRKTLSAAELLLEVDALREMKFDHVLLVSGEANQTVGMEYFMKVLALVRPHFSHISMEVQPLDRQDYELLIAGGLNTVLVYQETYHREDYKLHHPKGKKSNFGYRLDTPDRLGQAGIHKMGLGVLIGLEDWRTDSFFTALHLDYLEKTYWKTKYSLSFPRLRPFSGGLEPKVEMTDRELIQLICAYRLLNEEVELSLSTRESPLFRDHAIRIGITSLSAGSRTNPGGYVVDRESLEQFEIHDDRSPAVVAEMIRSQGYEPVWKDWDRSLAGPQQGKILTV